MLRRRPWTEFYAQPGTIKRRPWIMVNEGGQPVLYVGVVPSWHGDMRYEIDPEYAGGDEPLPNEVAQGVVIHEVYAKPGLPEGVYVNEVYEDGWDDSLGEALRKAFPREWAASEVGQEKRDPGQEDPGAQKAVADARAAVQRAETALSNANESGDAERIQRAETRLSNAMAKLERKLDAMASGEKADPGDRVQWVESPPAAGMPKARVPWLYADDVARYVRLDALEGVLVRLWSTVPGFAEAVGDAHRLGWDDICVGTLTSRL